MHEITLGSSQHYIKAHHLSTLSTQVQHFPGESSKWTGTDQVIVCMLGLEHTRDILQVVWVDLLGAPPGEGHSYDTLCDIRKVEFISLLHYESLAFLLKNIQAETQEEKAFQSHSTAGDSGQYLTLKVLSLCHCVHVLIDNFREWLQCQIVWHSILCLHSNGQQCVPQILQYTLLDNTTYRNLFNLLSTTDN